MTTAPAQKPTAPTLGDWQPLPTAGAPTDTPAPSDPRAMKALAITAAGGALALAGIGFTGSYTAVRQLAVDKHFGAFSEVFPIGVDAGIIVLLALDLILSHRRMPLPPLRWIAWGLTGATIAFNAAAGEGPISQDPLAAGMHAVIPILFIAAAEAARHFVARLAAITAGKTVENPPLIRWIVAPASTAHIWRRMKKWNVLTYDAAIQHQKEVKIYRARLRGKYKRVSKATAAELLVLELAGYGMSVADAIVLPQEEQRKRTEAEAKQKAEANRVAEAEAEAKHQAGLRAAEAEAKRRAEIAEAEAAEAEAEARIKTARAEAEQARRVAEAEAEANLKSLRARAEAAEAEANQNLQANLRKQQEEARVTKAEADARINEIARQQRINAEQDEATRRERSRLEAAAAVQQQEADRKRRADAAAAQAEAQKQDQARSEALRLREQAAASTSAPAGSASVSAPASATVAAATSASTSVSVRVPIAAPITNRRSKRQAEVDEVLTLIVSSGDPKSVSLKWIEQKFNLTQTTAFDRLSTAQKLWADGQTKSA